MAAALVWAKMKIKWKYSKVAKVVKWGSTVHMYRSVTLDSLSFETLICPNFVLVSHLLLNDDGWGLHLKFRVMGGGGVKIYVS